MFKDTVKITLPRSLRQSQRSSAWLKSSRGLAAFVILIDLKDRYRSLHKKLWKQATKPWKNVAIRRFGKTRLPCKWADQLLMVSSLRRTFGLIIQVECKSSAKTTSKDELNFMKPCWKNLTKMTVLKQDHLTWRESIHVERHNQPS